MCTVSPQHALVKRAPRARLKGIDTCIGTQGTRFLRVAAENVRRRFHQNPQVAHVQRREVDGRRVVKPVKQNSVKPSTDPAPSFNQLRNHEIIATPTASLSAHI